MLLPLSEKGFAKASIEAMRQTIDNAAEGYAEFNDDNVDSFARTIFDELRVARLRWACKLSRNGKTAKIWCPRAI